MHLAIVSPFPPTVTGVSDYGCHLAEALSQSGAFHKVTVLTERSPCAGEVEDYNGIRVERIWRRNSRDVAWRILTRLNRLEPNVVWFNLSAGAFGSSPLGNAMGFLT